jgi:aryl-alcohol dehydrogenase-like predicted oxidoreductase
LLQRALGSSGVEVPVLGLGAGRIGGPEVDDAAVDRLLGAASELGVTLVDTARSYGLSEERLGRALRGRRGRFVLSTKIGYGTPGLPDWTPECITAGVEAALQRLGTDRLDVVFLHSCELWVLEQRGVAQALARAVAQGKVRAAGYSGEEAPLAWAIGSGLFQVVQCSVSVVDPAGLRAAIPEAAGRGLGVFAKRPLGNAPWRFSSRPQEGDVAEAWERWQALSGFRAALQAAAIPFEEAAIRFTAFAGGVGSALLGTASPAHLAAAAAAVAKGPLPEGVARALQEEWQRAGSGWRGRI